MYVDGVPMCSARTITAGVENAVNVTVEAVKAWGQSL